MESQSCSQLLTKLRQKSTFVTLGRERPDDVQIKKHRSSTRAVVLKTGQVGNIQGGSTCSSSNVSQNFSSFASSPDELWEYLGQNTIQVSDEELSILVKKFASRVPTEDVCDSLLRFACIYQSDGGIKRHAKKSELATKILNNIKFYKEPCVQMLCQAVFLSILTKRELNEEQMKLIKEFLLLYFESSSNFEYFTTSHDEITFSSLPKNLRDVAEWIIEKNFNIEPRHVGQIDVFLLCCISACNILLKHDVENNNELKPQDEDSFSLTVVRHIIEKIDSLVSSVQIQTWDGWSNKETLKLDHATIYWIYKVENCFNVLETACLDELKTYALEYSDFLLLRDISWMLGFCLKKLFPKCNGQLCDEIEGENVSLNTRNLIKSCTESVLKVLMPLSTVRMSCLQRFGPSLIGKILICFFKTNYSTMDEKFELRIMSLEIILSMFHNEWFEKKDLFLLLLMKTKVEDPPIVSVDVLIKVLLSCLKNIKTLEKVKVDTISNEPGSGDCVNGASILKKRSPFEKVQKFGEEHMECNFIVSYLSVLLTIFCDGKDTFMTHVRCSILKSEAVACVLILEKFKEFLCLLGNTNLGGRVLLDRAIKVFKSFKYSMPVSRHELDIYDL